MSIPVLKPRVFWGLTTGIKGNAAYVTDHEVLYPAGGVLILHDFTQRTQRYIKMPDSQKALNIILISPNKKVVAVGEKGEKPTISIYDLTSMKRKKVLGLPYDSGAQEFACLAFTFDGKYLVAVTGEPDWMLLYYNWEKGKVESQTKANVPPALNGPILQVATNPADASVVVLVGPGLFRLLTMTDNVWRQYGYQKAENLMLSCVCWLTPDRVLAGTKDGRLVIVEYGDLRGVFKALEADIINLKSKDDSAQPVQVSQTNIASSEDIIEKEVRCLVAFPRGFLFGCTSGNVILFEKETTSRFIKRNVFCVVSDEWRGKPPVEMNMIHNLCINSSQDSILCTTGRSQIYGIQLWGPDIAQMPEIEFKCMGELLHHGPVTDLALCIWKPIFMTCGLQDRTIRVWDYITDSLLLSKLYEEDVHSVALHPTGLYATVGCSDKLRFVLVLIDNLQLVREFPIRQCKATAFSLSGHLFAATNLTVIQIFSSITFQLVYSLRGHSARIRSLLWSVGDALLFSCGDDGSVYEWNMHEGERAGDVVTKDCQYTDLAMTQDALNVYAVGTDGLLKEINDSKISREVELDQTELYSIVLSRSNLMMFVAGDFGSILSVKYPLALGTPEFAAHHMHNNQLTRIRLTYDDQNLISCSEDGTICIWKLAFAEGKTAKLDKDFAFSNEILINRDDLRERITNIRDLRVRIKELETEHAYLKRKTEAAHKEKVKELHTGYCAAIEELKAKIQELESEHTLEMNRVSVNIAETKLVHEHEVEKMESNYNEKLIFEYDKYSALEYETEKMKEQYDKKLFLLGESKKLALEEMSKDYENRLKEKRRKIQELIDIKTQDSIDHEEVKRQIEDDADREIIEQRARYELLLKAEQENSARLRGETGVLNKKNIAAKKEIEEFKHNMEKMHEEQLQLKGFIASLEKDIGCLKKEITERDNTIHDKERKIFDLKRRNQELEKFRFVLDYKIRELKMQIEPKDNDLKDKRDQIKDMEQEMGSLQQKMTSVELQSIELREKLAALDNELMRARHSDTAARAQLKRILTDLHNTAGCIQNPAKLKESVIAMTHQYIKEKEFESERQQDQEVRNEFMRQRQYLESTIAGLKKQVYKQANKPDATVKIMEENVQLIEELNNMRCELKNCNQHVRNLECFLGLSAKFVSPKEAKARLALALKTREDIHDEYKGRIQELEQQILMLREEVQRLAAKLKEDSSESPVCHSIVVPTKEPK